MRVRSPQTPPASFTLALLAYVHLVLCAASPAGLLLHLFLISQGTVWWWETGNLFKNCCFLYNFKCLAYTNTSVPRDSIMNYNSCVREAKAPIFVFGSQGCQGRRTFTTSMSSFANQPLSDSIVPPGLLTSDSESLAYFSVVTFDPADKSLDHPD